MPDIADQLDAAIGAAPSAPPALDGTLALGRRALRRRRMTYAVSAVATVVIVGGTAWAVSPGDDAAPRSERPGFATSPSGSEPADAKEPRDRSDSKVVWHDHAAQYRDGRLLVRPGWQVVQRIDDLPNKGTFAVAVGKGERLQWFLFGGGMTTGSLHAPEPGYDSFEQWVAVNAPQHGRRDQSGAGAADDEWPGVPRDDLVRFGTGETLVALDGVTIVEQRPSPAVGDSFASESDRSAVALVEVDGQQWYVLARAVDGPPQYIGVPSSKGGPDLDAFLQLAGDRYAEGGGGLL